MTVNARSASKAFRVKLCRDSSLPQRAFDAFNFPHCIGPYRFRRVVCATGPFAARSKAGIELGFTPIARISVMERKRGFSSRYPDCMHFSSVRRNFLRFSPSNISYRCVVGLRY